MTHLEMWTAELARRFPATDIEQPFDLGAAIFRAYELGEIPALTIRMRSSERTSRGYLGASGIGGECERQTWAQWRGLDEPFDGRLLRLFATGDVYEERMRAELRALGFQLAGGQARFEALGGRVRGHCDDIITLVDLPQILWEAKTANHRRSLELAKLIRDRDPDPLGKWSPKYAAQAHIYMAAFDLPLCLYEVTDKDTDSVIAFLVERDGEVVRAAGDKARAILADGIPARGYTQPRTPQCTRFCDHAEWCWYGDILPRRCGSCVSWRDGVCVRTGAVAVEVCGQYQALAVDGDVVSEWEAL
jgi:hypothetical protein